MRLNAWQKKLCVALAAGADGVEGDEGNEDDVSESAGYGILMARARAVDWEAVVGTRERISSQRLLYSSSCALASFVTIFSSSTCTFPSKFGGEAEPL